MTGFDSATAAIASARRAAAADRHAGLAFDVELRPLAALSDIVTEWRSLIGRVLEPNVFYEPAFALAAAPVLGRDVLAGLVWSRCPRQLVGLFPVRIEKRRYGLPFGILAGWRHPYAPFSAPLVDRETAPLVIEAWLAHVAQDPALPDLMLLPQLPAAGPLAAALAEVLAKRDCVAADFERHERPLLLPGADRKNYFERTMSGTRLRNMRRRQRRLQTHGEVGLEVAREGAALAAALEDFLRLEAGGWKGRLGTAAAQNEDIRRFMTTAVLALGAEGKVLIQRLQAGGKPVGAAMALISGDTAWGWKVAYDETYADCSPGVLAVAGLTDTILADPAIRRADSCAAPGDSMAPQLWNERLAMADWLFSVAPGAEWSFGIASRLEALRRSAIAAAKSARHHLLRR